MGKKITIDSSTLANKGLEVIEAAYLFDADPEQIEVVVHPKMLKDKTCLTNLLSFAGQECFLLSTLP